MNNQTMEKMKQMKLYGMARAMTSTVDMGLPILPLMSL